MVWRFNPSKVFFLAFEKDPTEMEMSDHLNKIFNISTSHFSQIFL